MGEFRTDADCLDYVEWLRWPAGFSCAGCGHDGGWRLSDERFRCSGCGGRTSVTAGTIFDRSRTPLTVWFNACWLFATGKDGISLAKRWLLGTHQGSVDDAHLASYLNEFVFRFNRRRSRSRGMVFYRVLELAVAHDPVRYQDLIATKRPRAVLPTPPQARGHPPSLEHPPANRPWRTTGLDSSG